MNKELIKIIKRYFIFGISVLFVYNTIIIEYKYLFEYIFSENFNQDKFVYFFNYGTGKFLDTIIIFIILFFMFREIDYVYKQPKWIKISCAIFSLFLLIGKSCSALNSFVKLFSSRNGIILALSYTIGFYILLQYICIILKRMVLGLEQCIVCIEKTLLADFLSKYMFISICIFLFIMWLPYIIIRFPGGVEWDAYYQIEQALGYRVLTDHWPVTSTILMGLFIKAGENIFHSTDIGLFSFVVFQAIICILAFSYIIVFLSRLKVRKGVIVLCGIWIGISPIFPGYLTSVIKDSLFSIMVTFTTVLIAESIYFNMKGRIHNSLLLLSSTAVSLLRNNGIYIIIFLLIGFVFYRAFIWKRNTYISIISVMLVTIIFYLFYSTILLPKFNIDLKDKRMEMLSIPFQQTARYLRDYPEDITTDELDIINQILDSDTIAEVYNPLLSDPVKQTFHSNKTSQMKDYFILWGKMFFRHPNVYIDATLCNIFGFFWPDARQRYEIPNSGLSIGTISNDQLIFSEPLCLKQAQTNLKSYVISFEKNPFTFSFANVGICILINIALIIKAVCQKDDKAILMLFPTITSILVCIAAPTWWHNGFRYALPIICTTPVMLGITFNEYQ